MRPEGCVWNKLERGDMHFFNFQNISSNLFSNAFFLIFGFGKDRNWKEAVQRCDMVLVPSEIFRNLEEKWEMQEFVVLVCCC